MYIYESLHMDSKPSTRIICVFYLKKRRVPAATGDSFYCYFRWFVAYYEVTGNDIEKYVVGKLTWQSMASLFGNPNLLVIVPLDHDALEPLRNYTRTVKCRRVVLEKIARIKSSVRRVPIPVLVFKDLISAWKHILFTTVLATLENPCENADIVAKAINSIKSEKVLEAFYIMIRERFNEIRGELIANPGKWYHRIGWVTRVGVAFRILYDINVE